MAEPKWLKDMNADEYLKEDFDAKISLSIQLRESIKMILIG